MQTIKQPKALGFLVTTEVWERFSYYTMSFLLVLYASTKILDGGLGWSKSEALALVGNYTLTVYSLPLFAGFIADKFLGIRKSVYLGGTLMMIGHFLMIKSDNLIFLYTALSFLAVGNGFFKPCMITTVGTLYHKDDPRRDVGYSYYYMGINVGSLCASVIGGVVSKQFGYDYSFSNAGVGMFLALVIFITGRKIIHKNQIEAKSDDFEISLQENTPTEVENNQNYKVNSKTAVLILAACFGFSFVWTLSYQLGQGGTLTLYIQDYTIRKFGNFEIPAVWFMSLNAFFVIVITPILSKIWLSIYLKSNIILHPIQKLSYGLICCSIAFTILTWISYAIPLQSHSLPIINPIFIVLFYFVSTLGELLVNPVMLSLISQIAPQKYTNVFQAISLLSIGIAAKVASLIGAKALATSPFEVFKIVTLFMIIITIILFLVKTKMILALKGKSHTVL